MPTQYPCFVHCYPYPGEQSWIAATHISTAGITRVTCVKLDWFFSFLLLCQFLFPSFFSFTTSQLLLCMSTGSILLCYEAWSHCKNWNPPLKEENKKNKKYGKKINGERLQEPNSHVRDSIYSSLFSHHFYDSMCPLYLCAPLNFLSKCSCERVVKKIPYYIFRYVYCHSVLLV